MMSKQEATDTIMATLGEYDALWDGELFPEIVDAELFDCFDKSVGVQVEMPVELFLRYDVEINEEIDRLDAMAALMGAVAARVENSLDASLFSEGVDDELYDCPLDDQTFIDCYIIDPPEDFPSARSLK
jgi:hypothetical protein